MRTSDVRRCCFDGAKARQGAPPHPGMARSRRRDRRARQGRISRRPPAAGAGDSLMMKLGEAANRLSRLEVLAPDGVDWALAVANRNFLICLLYTSPSPRDGLLSRM